MRIGEEYLWRGVRYRVAAYNTSTQTWTLQAFDGSPFYVTADAAGRHFRDARPPTGPPPGPCLSQYLVDDVIDDEDDEPSPPLIVQCAKAGAHILHTSRLPRHATGLGRPYGSRDLVWDDETSLEAAQHGR